METQQKKLNVLGLIGMILGIIAIIVAFIPCFGIYAVFPGIVGLILSAIGMNNASKGMAIAGLVCSLLGTGVASWQWYALNQAGKQWEKDLKDIEKAGKEMEKNQQESMTNDMPSSEGASGQSMQNDVNDVANNLDELQQQTNDAANQMIDDAINK
jgi:hypothetical protein